MRRSQSMRFVVAAAVALSPVLWSACTREKAAPSPSADSGKVPVTTKSEDARKEFLLGRDMSERLLVQDSIQHFDQAIALDPTFALAELARANAATTAQEFFDHLNNAVKLANGASEGERLLILATQAGSDGDTQAQKENLEKVVTAYPNDERAHLAVGNYYFGQQDYPQAIAHFKKATELAPNHSPAYNILGYAYRQTGDYTNAEQMFKKYTEMIPGDPNPYDSYGELLLKMGRFEDAITQYRKALTIDPNFVASHFGISGALMYQGKPNEAAAELQMITDKARSDGDRRTALFGMAVLEADRGQLDKAVQKIDMEYAVAEKANDVANMAADLQTKADILQVMQKYDAARQEYERSLKLISDSGLSQQIKDNARLQLHYDLATLALARKDDGAAKAEVEEFSKGAAASKNPALLRQSHELAGIAALAQKDYDTALTELAQANQQNPRNLYRLCQAYEGKGDKAKAQEYCTRAADFNSLPQLNYAFVRTKARKMAGK